MGCTTSARADAQNLKKYLEPKTKQHDISRAMQSGKPGKSESRSSRPDHKAGAAAAATGRTLGERRQRGGEPAGVRRAEI